MSSGYKDDEFCVFCGGDLIYMDQYGSLCLNHEPTVLYKYVKAKQSYSNQTRIVKDRIGIIDSCNSFEPEFSKTMLVEFCPLPELAMDMHKIFVSRFRLGKDIDKLIFNGCSYTSDNYNVIATISTHVKLNPDNFEKTLDKFKKLIVFS